MKGLLALIIQDFKRLLTNALFWVITASLVVIILVINFALPQRVTQEQYRLVTNHATLTGELATVADSEDEIRQAVEAGNTIGLMRKADGSITVFHPQLSAKTVHALMVTIANATPVHVQVESIHEGGRIVPFNKRMTPIFICFEALVIGFILGGALMLSEKEEGTFRALRVSPMGVDRYILSKTVLFSLIAVLYALLMAWFSVGFDFPALGFILLSFFGAAIFSLLGLAFTTLFKDLSSWFFSMAFVLSINMLPVMAYMEPTFSPLWIRVIPSYTIIFAYESILFGAEGITVAATLTLAGWCIGAYALSRAAVGASLLARGRR